jgi:hypothetical protein
MTQKIAPEHWRGFLSGALPRPPGEDFFLFKISFDTPTDPCWDDGFDVIGNWKSSCRLLHAKLLAEADQDRYARIAVYQGEEARRQIMHDLAEERRYQEQRAAQQNN